MKELMAFFLPVAVALVGMRLNRFLLGHEHAQRVGLGLRFALGLALGMVGFSQVVLLATLLGFAASRLLAYAALFWAAVELARALPRQLRRGAWPMLGRAHAWWLLLLPALYAGWVFARLSTLEGTLEFDGHAFWVFKAKLLYLSQGRAFAELMQQTSLSYAHLDYPLLVPGLYTLTYGAVGGVDEFVCKVWPFWMMVALAGALLSLGDVWRRPRPLPFLAALVLIFLPATLRYVRNEGGTAPMLFFVGLTSLLFEKAARADDEGALAATLPVLAGCAMTKLEGLLFAGLCATALLSVRWRRGCGPLAPRQWKAAAVAALTLVPYVAFRLTGPVPHPESGWLRAGLAAPVAVWHRLPETWLLNVAGRFFNQDFFRWQSIDGEGLRWAGRWLGASSFVNQQLSVLPWLLLPLLGLALWQGRARVALVALVIVDLAVFSLLSLAIACLPRMQAHLQTVIDFSTTAEVGRYFTPFFVALFLATVTAWFADPPAGELHARESTTPRARRR